MSLVTGRVVLPFGAHSEATPVCGHVRYAWVGGVHDRGDVIIVPGVAVARIIDGVIEGVHLSPGRWAPALVVDDRRYDLPEIIVDSSDVPAPPAPTPEPAPSPVLPSPEPEPTPPAPAQGTCGGPTTTVTTGTVSLGSATSAAFEVLGDVSYAAGITWLGGQPPAGFRGVVALSRSTGGTVLGVWRAFSGAAPTPVTPSPAPVNPANPTPAPVNPANPTPAPVNPANPTPAPVTPTTGEAATWNLAFGHNGWVVPGKVLARYFQDPVDGWVQAWQYPREQGTWTPIASDAPTYREQQPNHKALATAARPLGEGDAWVFTTKANLADKDSVFVANGDGGAKIVVKDGAYAYGRRVPQDGAYGRDGEEFLDGSWNSTAIKPGDKLEIKRSDGYAVGSVIRAGGQREQIFAFKFDWRNDTTAGAHGWNFNQVKAEVVRR